MKLNIEVSPSNFQKHSSTNNFRENQRSLTTITTFTPDSSQATTPTKIKSSALICDLTTQTKKQITMVLGDGTSVIQSTLLKRPELFISSSRSIEKTILYNQPLTPNQDRTPRNIKVQERLEELLHQNPSQNLENMSYFLIQSLKENKDRERIEAILYDLLNYTSKMEEIKKLEKDQTELLKQQLILEDQNENLQIQSQKQITVQLLFQAEKEQHMEEQLQLQQEQTNFKQQIILAKQVLQKDQTIVPEDSIYNLLENISKSHKILTEDNYLLNIEKQNSKLKFTDLEEKAQKLHISQNNLKDIFQEKEHKYKQKIKQLKDHQQDLELEIKQLQHDNSCLNMITKNSSQQSNIQLDNINLASNSEVTKLTDQNKIENLFNQEYLRIKDEDQYPIYQVIMVNKSDISLSEQGSCIIDHLKDQNTPMIVVRATSSIGTQERLLWFESTKLIVINLLKTIKLLNKSNHNSLKSKSFNDQSSQNFSDILLDMQECLKLVETKYKDSLGIGHPLRQLGNQSKNIYEHFVTQNVQNKITKGIKRNIFAQILTDQKY